MYTEITLCTLVSTLCILISTLCTLMSILCTVISTSCTQISTLCTQISTCLLYTSTFFCFTDGGYRLDDGYDGSYVDDKHIHWILSTSVIPNNQYQGKVKLEFARKPNVQKIPEHR